jgi:hypothetical protein
MILGVAVLLAVVLALITGGRWRHLSQIRFRFAWLTLVALGVQVLAVYAPSIGWPPAALLVISYGLLAAVVAVNWLMPGMPVLGAGLACNTLVIAANGGYMPVTPEAVHLAGLGRLVSSSPAGALIMGSKDVILRYSDTRLWMLSDILLLREPLSIVFSPGDLLLACGAFWFVYRTLCPAEPRQWRLIAGDVGEP